MPGDDSRLLNELKESFTQPIRDMNRMPLLFAVLFSVIFAFFFLQTVPVLFLVLYAFVTGAFPDPVSDKLRTTLFFFALFAVVVNAGLFLLVRTYWRRAKLKYPELLGTPP